MFTIKDPNKILKKNKIRKEALEELLGSIEFNYAPKTFLFVSEPWACGFIITRTNEDLTVTRFVEEEVDLILDALDNQSHPYIADEQIYSLVTEGDVFVHSGMLTRRVAL